MLLYFRNRRFGHVEGIVRLPKRKKPTRFEQADRLFDLRSTTQNEILPPSCQNRGSCDAVAWPKFPSGKFTSTPLPAVPFHA